MDLKTLNASWNKMENVRRDFGLIQAQSDFRWTVNVVWLGNSVGGMEHDRTLAQSFSFPSRLDNDGSTVRVEHIKSVLSSKP
jgi:hypothetical protein